MVNPIGQGNNANPDTAVPTSGPYSDAISAMFPSYNAASRQTVWDAFLTAQGLTANPSDTDTATQVQFLSFLQRPFKPSSSNIWFLF